MNPTPAEMSAEIKRLADWYGDVRVMASRGRATRAEVNEAAAGLHAAIGLLEAAARQHEPPTQKPAEREGCDYVCPTGSLCRKCGHRHDPAPPASTGVVRDAERYEYILNCEIEAARRYIPVNADEFKAKRRAAHDEQIAARAAPTYGGDQGKDGA